MSTSREVLFERLVPEQFRTAGRWKKALKQSDWEMSFMRDATSFVQRDENGDTVIVQNAMIWDDEKKTWDAYTQATIDAQMRSGLLPERDDNYPPDTVLPDECFVGALYARLVVRSCDRGISDPHVCLLKMYEGDFKHLQWVPPPGENWPCYKIELKTPDERGPACPPPPKPSMKSKSKAGAPKAKISKGVLSGKPKATNTGTKTPKRSPELRPRVPSPKRVVNMAVKKIDDWCTSSQKLIHHIVGNGGTSYQALLKKSHDKNRHWKGTVDEALAEEAIQRTYAEAATNFLKQSRAIYQRDSGEVPTRPRPGESMDEQHAATIRGRSTTRCKKSAENPLRVNSESVASPRTTLFSGPSGSRTGHSKQTN
eukprot:GSA25T00027558001.1